MSVFTWPEIEGFHNIRTFLKVDPGEWWRIVELLGGNSTVSYKAKVKLHGTNCAVQCYADGRVVPQSRTTDLSKSPDNLGFAKFIKSNEGAWKSVNGDVRQNMVIYGEWIGPGIHKSNVAVADLDHKVFAVFAARPMAEPNPVIAETNPVIAETIALSHGSLEELEFASANILVTEPTALQAMVAGIPDVYVIPWYNTIDINWKNSDEELANSLSVINDWVSQVEIVDPWVNAVFGKQGMGEGLVFYPVSHLGLENFRNLAFKAKGKEHRVLKQAAPAQINAETAASAEQFVDMVLTQARLEQGALATSSSYDKKQTGHFVSWIVGDVKKETQEELQLSNLTWDQVDKLLTTKARAWYLSQTNIKK